MATWSTRYGYTTLNVTATEDSTNIANNTSRVVVKVELYYGGGTSTFNANSQNLTVKVNGSTIGTKSFTYNLSSGKTLSLGTYTATVKHNADGTKTVPIAVSAGGGGDYGSISQNFKLATIARESSISGGWSWELGNNTTVTIARSSSSFTHTVWIDVWNNTGWVNVRSYTGVGTSVNSSFYDANMKNMATYMRNGDNNRSSIKTRIRVQTYNGSTAIGGTVSKEGTLKNVAVSRVTADNASVASGIAYRITRGSSSNYITHELIWRFGTFEKSITLANKDNNWATMSFTEDEKSAIYQQVKDTTSGTGGFRLITYFAHIQIRVETAYGGVKLSFPISDIAPTINNSFTFADINSSTVAITGSNQTAIQHKSNINVSIPANNATFKHGATGTIYSVSINGVEKTVPYSASAITVPFGEITTGTNTTITLSIIDSRGVKISSSKQLIVHPYFNPTLSGIVARANGFDDSTTIKASGIIASIGGKNKVSSVHYRFKPATSGTYSGYVALTPTLSGTNYTTNTVTRSFDNTGKHDIEFRIIDSVGTTVTRVIQLDSGKPIMFMDKKHKSVGIGKFPEYNNSLEVDGDIYVGATKLSSNPTQELKISTSSGYIDIGAKNSTYAHIYTDRSSFYFNKDLKVNGNDVFHSGDYSYGSNANGEWFRFPDGTQICTIANLPVTYSNASRLDGNWTFPTTFKGNAVAVANRSGYHGGSSAINSSSPTASAGEGTCVVRLWASNGSFKAGDNDNMFVIAIGRWK